MDGRHTGVGRGRSLTLRGAGQWMVGTLQTPPPTHCRLSEHLQFQNDQRLGIHLYFDGQLQINKRNPKYIAIVFFLINYRTHEQDTVFQ